MNKKLSYTSLFLLLLGWSTYLEAQMTFKARLVGRNETVPVLTKASGEITAVLNDSTLIVSGTFKNLSAEVDTNIAGGSHIHRGYAGQNGPIMFPLSAVFDADLKGGAYEPAGNMFTLSAAQVQALMDRRFYINIHTSTYPSGEIRGQLLPESEAYFNANLFGSNEVQPVISSGSGALVLELDGNNLVVSGSFANLDGDFDANIAGGAHLHMDIAGANGDISVPLNATIDADLKGGIFEAANNTFTLDSAQVDRLRTRGMYANIHTTKYPSGELRGQVVGAEALAVFRAHLSGSSEIPVVTSRAHGAVIVEIIKDSLVVASGSFHSLGSPLATQLGGGAHIHNGMAGRNGPVMFPLNSMTDSAGLNGVFPAAGNNFAFSATQINALFARRLYVNVHSETYQSGEIRGQLLPEGMAAFNAYLSSAFETPEVFSGARGDVKAELNGNRLTISGSFNNLGSTLATNIAGGAHIHLGLAGATGAIAFPLTATLDADSLGGVFRAADNSFVLDSAQVTNLKARRFYVNVHSTLYPSGEIRGQLLHQAISYFAAPLSGTSETASVNSTGRGLVMAEISGNKAYLSGSFSQLTSEFNVNVAGGAHVHQAIAGRNGGIKFPLGATLDAGNLGGKFEVDNNTVDITPGIVDTMMMRMHYANIHTLDYPAGEIRGQFLPLATHYFTTTLQGINEVQPKTTPATGAMKFEIVGNVLTCHGSFNGLATAVDVNINGGAHLHIAMPGANGGIAHPLKATLDAGNQSGIFHAADNAFQLDSAQIVALAEGNIYANVHTLDIPSGEVRGQVLKETNSFPAPETNITTPAPGTMLTIEGNPATPFTAEWLPGFEPDGNKQVYIWQLATDPGFANIIFQQNVGTQTSFTTDYATVDALLAAAGLNVGDNDTLYHRALGSDGSVQNHGTIGDVVLTRGVIGSQQGVDLELAITANVVTYAQYVDVTYTVTITNAGTETATGVSVAAGLPTGMVHTFNFTNKGTYNLFFERWDVGTLAPGETATLSLVLFPLIKDADITNFVQVLAQDQTDADSSPGNGTCCTPQEDDEAAVSVLAPPLPPMGGVTADLELFASVDTNVYDIYVDVFYHLMLVNKGPDDAAGINVRAGLPQGMVHTSNFATHGQYNLFFQRWETGFLAAGDTAHLDLVLFPLVDNVDLTNFFEVLTCDQDDPDSTPGNGVCCTPQEDDEAVVVVMPSMFIGNDPPVNKVAFDDSPGSATVYPSPTITSLKLVLINAEEQPGAVIGIYDQTGSLVFSQKTDLWKGRNEQTIDVSNLASGVYFVKLPGRETVRFVKM
jgi:uncharacterized repeat protein (TIGR01451 family)